MREIRRFSWGAALTGALAMLALLALAGALIVFGGFYPVAASGGHVPIVGAALEKAMRAAVEREAGGLDPPHLTRAEILEGGSHFKGMCEQCHGAPGGERDDFATAMNPQPPNLADEAGEWSRAEIFWIARHGIKMTGMPAFGEVADDEELWKIAAFVEQLPKVSARDYAALPDAHAEGGHVDGGHSH